jgi:hypothetical protein
VGQNLNERSKTTFRKILEDTGIDNYFLNSIAQKIRTRIAKWDCIKLKICTSRKTITKINRQPQNRRKSSPAIQ